MRTELRFKSDKAHMNLCTAPVGGQIWKKIIIFAPEQLAKVMEVCFSKICWLEANDKLYYELCVFKWL